MLAIRLALPCLILVALLTLAGCGGGGGVADSIDSNAGVPSAPGSTGSDSPPASTAGGRYQLHLSGAGLDSHTTLSCCAVIRKVEVLLDGQIIGAATYSTPTMGGIVNTHSTTPLTTGSGSHVLEFRIADQTTSPNLFLTYGGALIASDSLSSNRVIVNFWLSTSQPRSATLATGQSIRIAFTLP